MTATITPITSRSVRRDRAASVGVRDVTVRYGSTTALDAVSLDIASGELVALLGQSGCGKTTLLRSIAGLVTPTSGTIEIDGTDVTDTQTRHRPIGMVFQSYALFPNLTVAGNVGFPLKVRRIGKADAGSRVVELLALVGLSDHATRYPNELSGGQQQRVALARALACEPRVLLLDEPLSALDAVIRVNLRDEIRRVQQRTGITAVYVTHDQSEALAIADRVAVMAGGRIEEIATPREIYDTPASPFTARFVGARTVLDLPSQVLGRADWCRPLLGDLPPSSLVVAFRPEDAQLDPAGAPGVVEVRTFLGSSTRLQIRLDGGPAIAVDVTSLDGDQIGEGDRVTVRVIERTVYA
jgi:putative spermidine/putrescine transport system ATP-binding protein